MTYAGSEAEKIWRKGYEKTYKPKWYRANIAKAWEYAERYKNKYPARYLVIQARDRAIKKGIVFEITEDDIVIPEKCPILGIPLFFRKRAAVRRGPAPNSPSLDRIDPAKGYVKGNVQVISWRANSLKKDGTVEELRLIADYVAKQRRE